MHIELRNSLLTLTYYTYALLDENRTMVSKNDYDKKQTATNQ